MTTRTGSGAAARPAPIPLPRPSSTAITVKVTPSKTARRARHSRARSPKDTPMAQQSTAATIARPSPRASTRTITARTTSTAAGQVVHLATALSTADVASAASNGAAGSTNVVRLLHRPQQHPSHPHGHSPGWPAVPREISVTAMSPCSEFAYSTSNPAPDCRVTAGNMAMTTHTTVKTTAVAIGAISGVPTATTMATPARAPETIPMPVRTPKTTLERRSSALTCASEACSSRRVRHCLGSTTTRATTRLAMPRARVARVPSLPPPVLLMAARVRCPSDARPPSGNPTTTITSRTWSTSEVPGDR